MNRLKIKDNLEMDKLYKELPNEQEQIKEPLEVEQQLTKEEINKQIDYWWKQADTVEGYDKYAEAWEHLDHYRDLKQKLYK